MKPTVGTLTTVAVLAATVLLGVVYEFNLFGAYGPSGWPEILAVVLYSLSVWQAVRKSIWTWATGIVATAIYLYIFWELALYADAGLQVVFIVFSISGLVAWWRGDRSLTAGGRTGDLGLGVRHLVSERLGSIVMAALDVLQAAR